MFVISFLLFIGFFLLLGIVGFLFRLIGMLFGRPFVSPFSPFMRRSSSNRTERGEESAQAPRKRRKKVFDSSVGEYVDFEEIKEK